jgi:hypothetical protein
MPRPPIALTRLAAIALAAGVPSHELAGLPDWTGAEFLSRCQTARARRAS